MQSTDHGRVPVPENDGVIGTTWPDLFFAYVGTGEVADETRNYAGAYDALLKKARATGNQQALDELKSVGRPPDYLQRSDAATRKLPQTGVMSGWATIHPLRAGPTAPQ